jgi:diguanylate cyclase (GGDEF)-like protein
MTLIRSSNTKSFNNLMHFIPLPVLRGIHGLLLSMGALLGWFVLQWLAGRDPFSEEHFDPLLNIYMTLATGLVFSALGYAIGRREQVITSMALTDALTGLYNKRYFKNRLEQEFVRHQRYATPLTIIHLDIDFFKRVNDCFGHQAGDEVLKTLASTIMDNCRKNEISARVGGEEISIIACDCDLKAAENLAERIRSEIEKGCIIWQNHKIKVTASFGIASATADTLTAWEIYQQADEALYEAKKAGRNRVCTYSK